MVIFRDFKSAGLDIYMIQSDCYDRVCERVEWKSNIWGGPLVAHLSTAILFI